MKYVSYSHYFTWRHWVIVYALLVILSFAPLFSVAVASFLGKDLGCGDIIAGMSSDCSNGTVKVLFELGWLGLITLPFGGFLAILFIIANIIWHFKRKSGQDRL